MEIDPNKRGETARDAVLRATGQPPPGQSPQAVPRAETDKAAEIASTLRLLGHPPDDPSANSPCTRTMLLAFIGVEVAAMPGEATSEAVAPPIIALEKARLLMTTISSPH